MIMDKSSAFVEWQAGPDASAEREKELRREGSAVYTKVGVSPAA